MFGYHISHSSRHGCDAMGWIIVWMQTSLEDVEQTRKHYVVRRFHEEQLEVE